MKATIKYKVNEEEKTVELDNVKSFNKYPKVGIIEIKSSDDTVPGIENTIKIPEDAFVSVEIK